MNTEASPPEKKYIYFFNLTCEYDFGTPGFGKFLLFEPSKGRSLCALSNEINKCCLARSKP